MFSIWWSMKICSIKQSSTYSRYMYYIMYIYLNLPKFPPFSSICAINSMNFIGKGYLFVTSVTDATTHRPFQCCHSTRRSCIALAHFWLCSDSHVTGSLNHQNRTIDRKQNIKSTEETKNVLNVNEPFWEILFTFYSFRDKNVACHFPSHDMSIRNNFKKQFVLLNFYSRCSRIQISGYCSMVFSLIYRWKWFHLERIFAKMYVLYMAWGKVALFITASIWAYILVHSILFPVQRETLFTWQRGRSDRPSQLLHWYWSTNT